MYVSTILEVCGQLYLLFFFSFLIIERHGYSYVFDVFIRLDV